MTPGGIPDAASPRLLTGALAGRAVLRTVFVLALVGLAHVTFLLPWEQVRAVAVAAPIAVVGATFLQRAAVLRSLRRGSPPWRCALVVGLLSAGLLAGLFAAGLRLSAPVDLRPELAEPVSEPWRPGQALELAFAVWLLAGLPSALALQERAGTSSFGGPGLPWLAAWVAPAVAVGLATREAPWASLLFGLALVGLLGPALGVLLAVDHWTDPGPREAPPTDGWLGGVAARVVVRSSLFVVAALFGPGDRSDVGRVLLIMGGVAGLTVIERVAVLRVRRVGRREVHAFAAGAVCAVLLGVAGLAASTPPGLAVAAAWLAGGVTSLLVLIPCTSEDGTEAILLWKWTGAWLVPAALVLSLGEGVLGVFYAVPMYLLLCMGAPFAIMGAAILAQVEGGLTRAEPAP